MRSQRDCPGDYDCHPIRRSCLSETFVRVWKLCIWTVLRLQGDRKGHNLLVESRPFSAHRSVSRANHQESKLNPASSGCFCNPFPSGNFWTDRLDLIDADDFRGRLLWVRALTCGINRPFAVNRRYFRLRARSTASWMVTVRPSGSMALRSRASLTMISKAFGSSDAATSDAVKSNSGIQRGMVVSASEG